MNTSDGVCYAAAKAGVDGFDKLCVKKQMVTQKGTIELATNIMKRNIFKLVTHMLHKNFRLMYSYKYHFFINCFKTMTNLN
jgi:hypothetical protein